ncbi:MAG: TRAP transporter substrate-binding protein [Brooklawnia sp.]|uniref:TRAP transporter substrate-binding protein n=1 Tax=Brooklawnia sp. TaxID=2699740 RepID=UPI003C736AD6
MKKMTGLAVLTAGALLLSACGGGGGGTSSPSTPAGGATTAATGTANVEGMPSVDVSGEDPIVLTLGHAGSEQDPRQTASLRMKELLEGASNGQITVEIYPNSTLGTWEDMIEGLQYGSTHIVIESLLSLETYTDLASVETTPFLYEDYEGFSEVWDGELGDEIKSEVTNASGYAILGNMFRGSRELTTKEPVTSLADVQGLTIRTPSAKTMLDTWTALGARAEALPFNEVYSALESGVLDGQENPLDAILFNSIHEVAPNIAMTSHMFANYHFLLWNDYLTGLPDGYQQLITAAATITGEEYTQSTLDNEVEYKAELESQGAIFHELTDRPAWVEATQSVRDGLPAKVKEWVSEIQEIQK